MPLYDAGREGRETAVLLLFVLACTLFLLWLFGW